MTLKSGIELLGIEVIYKLMSAAAMLNLFQPFQCILMLLLLDFWTGNVKVPHSWVYNKVSCWRKENPLSSSAVGL